MNRCLQLYQVYALASPRAIAGAPPPLLSLGGGIGRYQSSYSTQGTVNWNSKALSFMDEGRRVRRSLWIERQRPRGKDFQSWKQEAETTRETGRKEGSMAGAGVGGTPSGRGSTYEQRDKCTTLTHQKYFSHRMWTSNVDLCLLKTQTHAYTWKYQRAHFLSLCGTSAPRQSQPALVPTVLGPQASAVRFGVGLLRRTSHDPDPRYLGGSPRNSSDNGTESPISAPKVELQDQQTVSNVEGCACAHEYAYLHTRICVCADVYSLRIHRVCVAYSHVCAYTNLRGKW